MSSRRPKNRSSLCSVNIVKAPDVSTRNGVGKAALLRQGSNMTLSRGSSSNDVVGLKSNSSATSPIPRGRWRDNPREHLRFDGLRAMLVNLEKSICTRLDRIEGAVRLPHFESVAQPTRQSMQTNDDGFNERMSGGSPWMREASMKSLRSMSDSWMPEDENGGACQDFAVDVDAGGRQQAPNSPRSPVSSFAVTLRPDWQEANLKQSLVMEVVEMERSWHYPGRLSSSGAVDIEKPWWLLAPAGKIRMAWDLLMVLIISHDLAVIPLLLAFSEESLVSSFLFWPFLVYWTLDILVNFFTTFYKQGHLEVRLSQIAWRYFTSWFLVDLFLVCSTWAELWIDDDHGPTQGLLGRVGKSMRALRVLRGVRILRVGKLQRVFTTMEVTFFSEYRKIVLRMAKLVILIVWLNHLIACCWFAIGDGVIMDMDGMQMEDSWVSAYGLAGAEVPMQYFTALHWSLTQFLPASIEISARNLPERIFSVVVLLFAMVTFSSFVSSITATVTELRQLTDEDSYRSTMLRRYLQSKHVPFDLSTRIMQYVEYRLNRQREEIQESEVDFLTLLSKPLQMELAQHIYAPRLSQHPFFQVYSEADYEPMRRICLEAVTQISLSTEDLLFTDGQSCENMYFAKSGRFQYHPAPRQQFDISPSGESINELAAITFSTDDARPFGEGEWCCEVCLWCPWIHCGSLLSERMSEVLAVHVTAFARITMCFHLVSRLSARYAEQYVIQMRSLINEGNTVNDLTLLTASAVEDMVQKASVRKTGYSPHKDSARESSSVRPEGTPANGDECVAKSTLFRIEENNGGGGNKLVLAL